MRNFFAGLILSFSFQQVAWTVLDFGGLKQYGAVGWPDRLDPVGGGIVAVIALVVGLFVIDRRPSISRATAIGLAVFSGIHFWLRRRPANPYTDYLEDNVVWMLIHLVLIAAVLFVVCGIEFILGRSYGSIRPTEQGGATEPAGARLFEPSGNENPNPESEIRPP